MNVSKDVCKDVCIHIQAMKDGWVCPKGSILALKEPSAVGQVPDEISPQLTCSHFTGAHRRQTVALEGQATTEKALFIIKQHAGCFLLSRPCIHHSSTSHRTRTC